MRFTQHALALFTLLLALSTGFVGAQGRQGPDPHEPTGTFEEELELYNEFAKRPALFIKTRGIERFARMKTPEAFEVLIDRYNNPGEPTDHLRYLITGICAQHFSSEAFVDMFDEWTSGKGYNKPEKAWLWLHALAIHVEYRGSERLLEIIGNKRRDHFIKAAAIKAIGLKSNIDELRKAADLVFTDKFPRVKGIERAVLIESFASAMMSLREKKQEPAFVEVAEMVITATNDEKEKTEYRTKLTVGRCFSKIYDSEKIFLNSSAWRSLVRGAMPKEEEAGRTSSRTRFIGVEGSGKHVVFVCDASDSMLIPLTAAEKEELKKPAPKRGPTTGERHAGSNEDTSSEEQGAEAEEEEDDFSKLPWDNINNRWEALREFLKIALEGLSEDMTFAVVLFGDEAETLKSTRSMTVASANNTLAAINEVMAIKPGPKQPNRPNGTLMGKTNIHGALTLAFQLNQGSTIQDYEHIREAGFESGCDTIFLLSDGDPTSDNFMMLDKREPDIQVGDPEARTRGQNQPVVTYTGPYGWMPTLHFLIRDVARMNMFRRCEINCIGIGEANMMLLNNVANVGSGSVRQIGGNNQQGQGRKKMRGNRKK